MHETENCQELIQHNQYLSRIIVHVWHLCAVGGNFARLGFRRTGAAALATNRKLHTRGLSWVLQPFQHSAAMAKEVGRQHEVRTKERERQRLPEQRRIAFDQRDGLVHVTRAGMAQIMGEFG